jgi:glutathione S-transferase
MHEVIYFESPGYAEPTRLCLELSGKPWKNTVVDWDGYQELKEAGAIAMGVSYLILKTPQGTIAESGAIMRYAASLAGLDSDDLYTQGKINEIIDVIDSWRTSFHPYISTSMIWMKRLQLQERHCLNQVQK